MKKTLEGMDGVMSADVDNEKGTAIVTLKQGATFDEDLARSELDKDMYTLTDCSKYAPPVN